ncbi:MAG: YeeE/YedE thiosulfate transporter family protein [Verrucomicrobiales bacterium]|nr:YeeE/YedE thiosulfate transporter family protein [Verrucomicrobiales bacterium]
MNLPISTSSTAGLILAGVFGLIFGILLHKGRVTNYNVIVNMFRFKDFTVLKVMLSAIVVGGIGVYIMMAAGLLEGYHIKPTNVAGLVIGGALFGIGMVVYGYCPGTGVAAVATGSVHALIGFLGMLVGGVFYALSYPWVKAHILNVGDFGKVRLPEASHIPEFIWWIVIAAGSVFLFKILPKAEKQSE